MDNNLISENEYSKNYSDKSLFEKIKMFAHKAGIKVIYAVLLLYYLLQKSDIPIWAKGSIIGSLGYFISPIDAVIDITPVVGYVDDFGVIIAALVTVAMYIDDEVKSKARNKLSDWFGEYNESSLDEVDSKISKK